MTADQFFKKLESIPSVFRIPEAMKGSYWNDYLKIIYFDVENLVFIPWLLRGCRLGRGQRI